MSLCTSMSQRQNVHWFYTVACTFSILMYGICYCGGRRQFLTQMLQTFRQQYSSIYLPNGVKYFFLCSVDLELHKVCSLWKQTLSSEKRASNGLEPEAILVSSLTLHLDTFFLPCFSLYTHKESRSLFKELYLLYFEQDLAYIIVFDWFKGMK